MKAFIVDRYGKGKPLRAGDVPEPDLRDDEVLIEVHAAATAPMSIMPSTPRFNTPERSPVQGGGRGLPAAR